MFDNPIFFLILISLISAISEWLGKRRKARQMMDEYGPGAEVEVAEPQQPVATKAERRRAVQEEQSNWEERLRRMLEGEAEPEKPRVERPVVTEPVSAPRVSTPVATVEAVSSSPVASPITATTSYEEILAKSKKGIEVTRRGRGRKRGSRLIDFQSPNSIRKAIVASVVLGPPKGAEEDSDLLRL